MIIRPTSVITNTANLDANYQSDDWGRIGGVVYRGEEKFLLTCYHCVWNENLSWNEYSYQGVNSDVATYWDGQFHRIGFICQAARTKNLDIALIKIDDPSIEISDSLLGTNFVKDERIIDRHYNNIVRVKMHVPADKIRMGDVTGTRDSTKFYYGHNETDPQFIEDLLIISPDKDFPTFSKGGDSGSFVLTLDDEVVGIIIGKNLTRNLSYAINIRFIKKRFNVCFYQK